MKWNVLLAILGSSLVTFLPRVLPLLVFSRVNIPDWAMRWLNYVPVAVMSALVAQELFLSDDNLALRSNYLEIIASVPTILVALLTRSLLGTVIVGMITIMLLRLYM